MYTQHIYPVTNAYYKITLTILQDEDEKKNSLSFSICKKTYIQRFYVEKKIEYSNV